MEEVTLVFGGFESLHGMDEDLMYAIQEFLEKNDISSEFTGDLIISIKYQEE
jgi:hypothetical protein